MRRAREAGAALAYVNMVGGQDELVFDGDSIIVAADGALLARGPQFEEALVVADLDLPAAARAAGRRTQPVDARRRHRDHDPAGDAAAVGAGRAEAAPAADAVERPGRCGRGWSDQAEVCAALVTGLRDYVRKNGFRSVILGLSGGIDSALVATIAADAIGPDRVHVVLMPSRYSSGALGDRRRGPGQAAGPARA